MVRRNFDRITPHGLHQTQPNQVMSLKEMLQRAVRGERIPEHNSVFEYSSDDIEEEDVNNDFDHVSCSDSIFEPDIAELFLEKEELENCAQARALAKAKARKAKAQEEQAPEEASDD